MSSLSLNCELMRELMLVLFARYRQSRTQPYDTNEQAVFLDAIVKFSLSGKNAFYTLANYVDENLEAFVSDNGMILYYPGKTKYTIAPHKNLSLILCSMVTTAWVTEYGSTDLVKIAKCVKFLRKMKNLRKLFSYKGNRLFVDDPKAVLSSQNFPDTIPSNNVVEFYSLQRLVFIDPCLDFNRIFNHAAQYPKLKELRIKIECFEALNQIQCTFPLVKTVKIATKSFSASFIQEFNFIADFLQKFPILTKSKVFFHRFDSPFSHDVKYYQSLQMAFEKTKFGKPVKVEILEDYTCEHGSVGDAVRVHKEAGFIEDEKIGDFICDRTSNEKQFVHRVSLSTNYSCLYDLEDE